MRCMSMGARSSPEELGRVKGSERRGREAGMSWLPDLKIYQVTSGRSELECTFQMCSGSKVSYRVSSFTKNYSILSLIRHR